MKRISANAAVFGLISTLSFNAFAANVAMVNGKPITDEDLRRAASTGGGLRTGPELLKDPANRARMIANLIDQELLVQDAQAKKIESTKEYQESLAAFKRQLLVDGLVRRELTGKVTEKSAQDYFNKNKNKYTGDQVRVFHILSANESEAAAVMAEVSKSGVDFQSVAEKKSKDPTAKNNRGDIGYFPKGVLDQAFTDAAFTAKTGQIVGPIRTAFGFHVIKVIDRKIGKSPEFAEVEQRVRADIQRDLMENLVANLRKKAKITK